MSDLIEEIRTELRREKLSDLGKKYGPILAGILTGIVVMTGAVTWYNSYQEQQQLHASSAYFKAQKLKEEALSKLENQQAIASTPEQAEETTAQTTSPAAIEITPEAKKVDVQKTATGATIRPLKATEAFSKIVGDRVVGYSELAALDQADLLTEAQEYDQAIAAYDAIRDNTDYPLEIRELASLQAISLMIDHQTLSEETQAKIDERLNALSEAQKPWRYSATEMLAFRAYKNGDLLQALGFFKQLSGDTNTPDAMFNRATKMAMLLEAELKDAETPTQGAAE